MEVDKRTRGHTLKILKRGARLDCRKYSFSQRVVNCLAAMGHKSGPCVRCEEPLVALIYSDLSGLFNQ